jgi:hypothetical protein
MSGLLSFLIVAIILYFWMLKGSSGSHKPKSYACSRCGVLTDHNKSTLAAKKRGTKNFYCKSCHEQWRKTHPTKNSGCLGIMVLFIVLPAIVSVGMFIV